MLDTLDGGMVTLVKRFSNRVVDRSLSPFRPPQKTAVPEPQAPPPPSSGPSQEAILGVDLGGTQVRVGKVRAGIVEQSAASPISSQGSAEVVAGELYRAIDDFFDAEVAGIDLSRPERPDSE